MVLPGGSGVEAFWASLHRPSRPQAVSRLAPADAGMGRRAPASAGLVARAALAAAHEAMTQAGLHAHDLAPSRLGVSLGAGLGGLQHWEDAVLQHAGGAEPSVLDSLRFMPSGAAAAVAQRYDARGPCRTLGSACAAGTDAVLDAAATVASGRCDVVLAGGAEAAATDTNVAALARMGALSPSGAARPFDRHRDGLTLAEGTAVLVVEALDHALARGASPLAELLGGASTCDAHHPLAPHPEGRGTAECLRLALADARLTTADVHHVNAHATGTVAGDRAEAAALRTVLGPDGPPVTAVKGATGHTMAAAGAVDAAATVLATCRAALPPVTGLEASDAADLDLTVTARPWVPGVSLSVSAGFGGHNAVLVLAPH